MPCTKGQSQIESQAKESRYVCAVPQEYRGKAAHQTASCDRRWVRKFLRSDELMAFKPGNNDESRAKNALMSLFQQTQLKMENTNKVLIDRSNGILQWRRTKIEAAEETV
ncbi:MAG: hypothetical protein MZU84_02905 [Sphingobacterium sp.]|nr:hypothetical protein [Sphingobacterium sp.]